MRARIVGQTQVAVAIDVGFCDEVESAYSMTDATSRTQLDVHGLDPASLSCHRRIGPVDQFNADLAGVVESTDPDVPSVAFGREQKERKDCLVKGRGKLVPLAFVKGREQVFLRRHGSAPVAVAADAHH